MFPVRRTKDVQINDEGGIGQMVNEHEKAQGVVAAENRGSR